jgi:flagellar basal body-associated protein FliL
MKKSIKVLLSLVIVIIIGTISFILQNKLSDSAEHKEQEKQDLMDIN